MILYAACWIRRPKEFPMRRAAIAGGTVFVTVVLMVAVIYWPETVRCWRTQVPQLSTLVVRGNPAGEILFYVARKLHLPAHAYLTGLNAVVDHNAGGHASYLLGMRSDTGWWYYFPVVFAVKSTMAALAATMLLLAAALWQGWGSFELAKISPMTLGLALPPLLYFVFSMTSGINIGMRHILPVYPFLYVGAAAWLTTRTNWRPRRTSWPPWWPCRLASARASRPITWPSSMSWPAVPGADPNTWWIPISTGGNTMSQQQKKKKKKKKTSRIARPVPACQWMTAARRR